jgi:DNA repair protein RadC
MNQQALLHEVPRYTCRLVREGSPLMVREPSVQTFRQTVSLFEGIRLLPHEEVHAAYLDGRGHVVGYEVLARGGRCGAALLAADVFRGAILANARAFVMAHNHPSGDPRASHEDVVMTKRLKALSEELGVALLDHVILARDGETSVTEVL